MARENFRVAFVIDYLVSEYSDLVIQGMRAACKQFDMELLILPIAELHNIKKDYDYQYVATTALLTQKNIDGIIFPAGTQMHFLSRRELEEYLKNYNGIPIVNISSTIPNIPSVNVGCYYAYKEIINNLVDVQKCKKFGIMGVETHSVEMKIRSDTIYQLLQEKGIALENIETVNLSYDYHCSMIELDKHFSKDKKFEFDAVIAVTDELAFAVMDFCRINNIRIPEDVCVVGFDNVTRTKFSNPTLTSIDQNFTEQGFYAVKVMKAILDEEPLPEIELIESKAVFRESTNRNKESAIPENDYAKNEIAFVEENTKFSSSEWYHKKFQLYQVTKFYTDMQSNITTEQLSKRLNWNLKSFGITASAIVLYEKPIEMSTPFDTFQLPHKAYVYTSFDYATNVDIPYNKKSITFDPNETMLPDGLIKVDDFGIFAIPLFHTVNQYGYILFRVGTYDIAIYDLLTKILASIMTSVFSYTAVQKEKVLFNKRFDSLDIVARTDELTELKNRRGMFEFGQALLNIGQAMEHKGLVIYCDMDGLKKINDKYGHEAGDKAIIAEANILKNHFRSNDVIARIGGDEFAMVCPGLTPETFTEIRDEIEADCTKWSEENEDGYKLSISMGFVQYPSEKGGYQITKLLSEADDVLYKEKKAKKAALKKKK